MYSVRTVQGEVNDRYEPLPGLLQLPGYVWRRLGRPARIAIVAAGLAAVVAAILAAPSIQRSNEERARADAERSAQIERQQIELTRRQQQPRFARGAAAGPDLGARGRLLSSAQGSILADATSRSAAGEFNGPIERVACEAFPPGANTVPAETDPAKRVGLYECIAVTSEIPATSGNRTGLLGHPYRMRINFDNGRYAFCKVRGRPGELAVKAPRPVNLPRVCGG
jgi:hypothetical protein